MSHYAAAATFSPRTTATTSRGCEYVFAHYENREVVVYCYSAKGALNWDACLHWDEGDRVLDVLNKARRVRHMR